MCIFQLNTKSMQSAALFLKMGKCPTDTCPKTHLCRLEKGRETRGEARGWEKKNRASKEAETSDNIQERMNLLSICHMTMHVTCSAVSLDQLEPKKAHGKTSETLAAVFV